MKKITVLLSLLTISIAVTSIFVYSLTYSWIRRKWTPNFYVNNLLIEASGSLSIKLTGDPSSNSQDSIDLNDVLNLSSDFKLRQVTNYDGESDHFFAIDYNDGVGKEKLLHLQKSDSETWVEYSKNHGYIEAKFLLCSTTRNSESGDWYKHIFFDIDNTYIETYDPTTSGGTSSSSLKAEELAAGDAIRVSITFHDTSGDGDKTYLFKRENENNEKSHCGAITTQTSGSTYYADGKYIYLLDSSGKNILDSSENKILNGDIYGTYNNCKYFSDYDGGFAEASSAATSSAQNDNFNKVKALFEMATTGKCWVTVRIWLEGYDSNCTDDIGNQSIDLKITFNSYDSTLSSSGT